MTCRVCRHTVLLASAAAKLDKTGAGKQLARAVRAVPIKLIYVAKSSSGPAEACAGEHLLAAELFVLVQKAQNFGLAR